METSTVIIVMLLCLIIYLLFGIYDKLSKKEDFKVESLQSGQANPRDINIFRQGLQQSWMHVNISLYKMWNDLDILDFDSIQTKLQQTLESLSKDQEEMNKWAEKFKEYLKEQGK
jgi:hypothetical protein